MRISEVFKSYRKLRRERLNDSYVVINVVCSCGAILNLEDVELHKRDPDHIEIEKLRVACSKKQ